eukprot:630184-Hanusia_phi.AAC.1
MLYRFNNTCNIYYSITGDAAPLRGSRITSKSQRFKLGRCGRRLGPTLAALPPAGGAVESTVSKLKSGHPGRRPGPVT